jgi:hypothetical protein
MFPNSDNLSRRGRRAGDEFPTGDAHTPDRRAEESQWKYELLTECLTGTAYRCIGHSLDAYGETSWNPVAHAIATTPNPPHVRVLIAPHIHAKDVVLFLLGVAEQYARAPTGATAGAVAQERAEADEL